MRQNLALLKAKLTLIVAIVGIFVAVNNSSGFFVYAVDNSKLPTYRCIESQDPEGPNARDACCRTQKEIRDGKEVEVLYCIICEKDRSSCSDEVEVGVLGLNINPALNSNVNPDLSVSSGGIFDQKDTGVPKNNDNVNTARQGIFAADPNMTFKDNDKNTNTDTAKQNLMSIDPELEMGTSKDTEGPVDSKTSNTVNSDLEASGTLTDDGAAQSQKNDLGTLSNNNLNQQVQTNTGDNSATQSQVNDPKSSTDLTVNRDLKADAGGSSVDPDNTTDDFAEFKCSDGTCSCQGDNDCNDMFSAGVCTEDIFDRGGCSDGTCTCTMKGDTE
ncbi:MAG TPA: hypothetical protein VJ772_01945 [Nitrososphaeraceae archaeon]|nr:hypothetical protein [Nitrososphaeraceae archaeon]